MPKVVADAAARPTPYDRPAPGPPSLMELSTAKLWADSIEKGKAAMWIQFSAECLVYLLYFWSLIAPRLFPDRDFSTGP